MNELAILRSENHDEAIRVLQSSLYPGAKPESIELVLSYCRVNNLDPMLKPVHIVPTNLKVSSNPDKWEKRDVLMPGISDYRIKAARSNAYAGKGEPEFGPTKHQKVGATELSYPEFCRVTVRRIVGGQVCEYTAKEYWLENYATKGSNSVDPNAMWAKRPFGQLAKCAEAQALRMAFPEFSGSQPTAEEMEGKTDFSGPTIDGDTVKRTPPQVIDGSGNLDLSALDGEVNNQWGQALKIALSIARSREEVERIGGHPRVGETIASGSEAQRKWLSDMLADAYARFGPPEDVIIEGEEKLGAG